jgi:NADPH:quinone reductase-like Zn-dependent oxidoreductase
MKAVIYTQYGPPDVLQIKEIEKPVPKENEVLVKVRAASINPFDWHMIRGTPFLMRAMMAGLRKPKEPRVGVDCAGTVEAVGREVTQFKPGDDVFGGKAGALAEYLCVPADGGVALKPANVTFEQAAGIQIAGCTALQALRDKGKVQPGQNVLINGASGGVGTFAVQIARSMGAHVAGVCSSRNAELVRSLGADRVIDYTNEDFTKSDERYDVIIDNVGTQPLSRFRQILKPKGIYIMIGGGGPDEGGLIGPMGRPIQALLMSPFIGQKMGMMLAKASQDDLKYLAELMQAGKVTTVIDRTYPLSQIADAIRYLEHGHARGKVIITIAPEDDRSPDCRASVSDAGLENAPSHRDGLQLTQQCNQTI